MCAIVVKGLRRRRMKELQGMGKLSMSSSHLQRAREDCETVLQGQRLAVRVRIVERFNEYALQEALKFFLELFKRWNVILGS